MEIISPTQDELMAPAQECSIEDECMSYKIDTTPKKPKSSALSDEMITPTARKNSHQVQIDRAYSMQVETNNLIRQLIKQNEKIIEQNTSVLFTLNEIIAMGKSICQHKP